MSLSRSVLRILPCLLAVPFLASCSYTGGDLPALYTVGKNLLAGPKDVTLEDAATVPYASIGVRLGSKNQIMLVLASDNEGIRLWTSDARISIVTREGRVVRTAGLGRDLTAYSYKMVGATSGQSVSWSADFRDMNLVQVGGQCQRSAPQDETIVILGKTIRTRRVEEHCETDSRQISWSFTNTFWLDPQSNIVWRSIQHIHPKMPEIEIVTLRPVDRGTHP